jgi:ADP-ribose pyrophosphatase
VTILPVDNKTWSGSCTVSPSYRQDAAGTPAGTLNPGELPEVSAHRELREEIGMAAGKLSKLGEFFLAPGYSSEYMHVFYATDLYAAPLPGDEDEFLSILKVPRSRVRELVGSGEIQDGKTLAALFLAKF